MICNQHLKFICWTSLLTKNFVITRQTHFVTILLVQITDIQPFVLCILRAWTDNIAFINQGLCFTITMLLSSLHLGAYSNRVNEWAIKSFFKSLSIPPHRTPNDEPEFWSLSHHFPFHQSDPSDLGFVQAFCTKCVRGCRYIKRTLWKVNAL